MQAGEPEIHLRFHPGHLGHLHVAGIPDRVVQQRRFADTRLPPQHQYAAQPVPSRRQQPLNRLGLHRPVHQYENIFYLW